MCFHLKTVSFLINEIIPMLHINILIVVKIIRFKMRIFEFSISQVFTDYIYSIAELPSPTDPGDMENASSSFPMVSMPGNELTEEQEDHGVLTSPNLVQVYAKLSEYLVNTWSNLNPNLFESTLIPHLAET